MQLSPTQLSDLEILYQFQLDPIANYQAAFTSKNPNDREAYMEKWSRIVQNPEITMQTIRIKEEIVGSIIRFEREGDHEISYGLERSHWGKGIVTAALQVFLEMEKTRPLYGRTAFDNIGSQRVLEKSGFLKIGTATGFANARNQEIEEYIYRLD